MNHNKSNEYNEYDYKWSKIGRLFRNILNYFGLALEKDWVYCDDKWIMALSHCEYYLFNGSKEVQKNMAELLVSIDDGMIDLYKKDLELYKEGCLVLDKKYVDKLQKALKMIEDYKKENE